MIMCATETARAAPAIPGSGPQKLSCLAADNITIILTVAPEQVSPRVSDFVSSQIAVDERQAIAAYVHQSIGGRHERS